MRTEIKIRVDSVNSEHVSTTVFSGNEGQTLANWGRLVMSHGEYQLWGCAMLMGAERMPLHLKITFDDKVWNDYQNEKILEDVKNAKVD